MRNNSIKPTQGNNHPNKYYQYGLRNMKEIVFNASFLGNQLHSEFLENLKDEWSKHFKKSDIHLNMPDSDWVHCQIGNSAIGFIEKHFDKEPEYWYDFQKKNDLKEHLKEYAKEHFRIALKNLITDTKEDNPETDLNFKLP